MKIIVSPSKTKKISNLRGIEIYEEPCFSEITHKIVKELEKMSVSEIEKKFKLKKEQAEKLSKFYKTFETQDYGHALGTYTGIAFTFTYFIRIIRGAYSFYKAERIQA